MLVKEAVDVAGNAIWHSLTRTVSVICTLLVIAGIIFAVNRVLYPLPSTTQKAEKIDNTYITNVDDSFFLGIKLFGFKFGVSKPKKVDRPVITQTK